MKLKFAALSLMLGCAVILGACAPSNDSVETQPTKESESVQIEPEIREESAEMGTSLGEKKQLREVEADPDKAVAPDGVKSSEIPSEESPETFVIEETEVEAQPVIEETDSSVKSDQLKDGAGAVLEMKEGEIPADAQLTDPASPDAAVSPDAAGNSIVPQTESESNTDSSSSN